MAESPGLAVSQVIMMMIMMIMILMMLMMIMMMIMIMIMIMMAVSQQGPGVGGGPGDPGHWCQEHPGGGGEDGLSSGGRHRLSWSRPPDPDLV